MRFFSYQTLLAACHFCSDINQSALAAVLPFLVAAYHYDYATAAMLVLSSNIIGSLIQPLLGTLSDKHNWPWIMPLGLFMAGGGIALTGVTSDFYLLCLFTMISGIGVAMFHPQGALMVNRVSTDDNRGISLSVFSFGGNMGFTFGAAIISASIAFFGLPGTLIFFIPEIIICTLLLALYPRLKAIGEKSISSHKKHTVTDAPDQWGSFCRLGAVVFGRSIMYLGLNTFIVLYFMNHFHESQNFSNLLLSVYYGIGALFTLIGGKLGDKHGYRTFVRFGFLLAFPAALILAWTDSSILGILCLIILGAALNLTYSPMVVLGQQYLPNRVGLASGITLGLAVSVGGITAPLLGKVGDMYGLETTFYVIALITLIPLISSFTLPKPKKQRLLAVQSRRIFPLTSILKKPDLSMKEAGFFSVYAALYTPTSPTAPGTPRSERPESPDSPR